MKSKTIYSVFFLIVFCLLFTGNAFSVSAQTKKNAKCLVYEPEIVNLSGKLIRKIFVNASEQKETVWLVKLESPNCVASDAGNEFNSAFNKITEVQLVFNNEQLRKSKNLVNQKVFVTGTLFAGHTQHHFTDVLLMVAEVKKK